MSNAKVKNKESKEKKTESKSKGGKIVYKTQQRAQQKKLFEIISEKLRKGEKISVKECMIEAGYSETYADSSTQLKRSVAWQELMEQHIPDDLLAKVHEGLLTNKKEWRARDAGLDKAYKLKKRYGEQTVRHKFGESSDEELEEELANAISQGLGDQEGASTPERE